MKDRLGIAILPYDTVKYCGIEPLSSSPLIVVGLHNAQQQITVGFENDSDCKYSEAKVNPADVEVEIRKGEPRSSVKKRGKKAWDELQDDKRILEFLQKKDAGELNEWFQPLFVEVIEE